MTFAIRPAKPADKEAILALFTQTLAEHRARFPDNFGDDTSFASQFLAKTFAKKSKSAAFVAEQNDRVIGWTGLNRFDVASSGKDHEALGVVIDLTVEEAARGKGVATALIEALVSEARESGITLLQGDVWIGARSSGVLARAGIQPLRTTHELRLADRKPGPPGPVRFKQWAERFNTAVTLLLAATVVYLVFWR